MLIVKKLRNIFQPYALTSVTESSRGESPIKSTIDA